jgi:xylose dehydrogenase (NAD/NADP)
MTRNLKAFFDDFTSRPWQTLDPAAVDEPIRIAVVGLGWFAREWAVPGMERSAYTEAAVAVDVDPAAVAEFEREHGLIGLTPEEFHQGAATDEYDAVYVATPNATHLDYVETAAGQGKAVLCEKPMEATVDRAEQLVEACATADIPLMVGYRMQTEPAVRRCRELLRGGFIGDVVHVHGNMSQRMLGELTADVDQWRLDHELSGGCALMDIGIYPLNTTRFLLEEDPLEVYGHVRSEHEAFNDVDEHAAFELAFPDEIRGLFTVSQNAAHASRLEITGTDGQLILDPAFYEREDRELAVVRGEVTADIEFEQRHQLEEQFAYFGHQLLSHAEIYPHGPHALTDMRALAAVYESSASGEPVSV